VFPSSGPYSVGPVCFDFFHGAPVCVQRLFGGGSAVWLTSSFSARWSAARSESASEGPCQQWFWAVGCDERCCFWVTPMSA